MKIVGVLKAALVAPNGASYYAVSKNEGKLSLPMGGIW